METKESYANKITIEEINQILDDSKREVEKWKPWMQEGEVRFNERRYSKD